MGPSLQTFSGLDMLSIAIRPDPPMNSPHGSGDAYRESLTRRLAEHVIADYGLSRVMRIELRWHGWTIEGGNLMALSRTELARLPQSWMFKLNGPESQ